MAIKSVQYKQSTFDISYEILNPNRQRDVIILHGWGSNKNLMKKSFAPYMDSFRHIYIDLPGFGNSTCSVALTTEDVARIVELFMIHINAHKDIVVGHSFGGKVALILEPELLVLLSTAGILVPKSFNVRTKIALFKLFKLFGLSKFRSLFVAEDAKELNEYMYETFKNVVDEDYSDNFANYDGKTLICWGRLDSATPLSSGKRIASLIEDATFVEYEGDHYFFMDHSRDITQKIEEKFLKRLEK